MAYYIRHDHTASQPTPSTGYYDTNAADYKIDFSHPDFIEVNEEIWQSRKSTSHVLEGKLVEKPPLTPEELAMRAKSIAASQLKITNESVVLRCFEEGIPIPTEWKNYRDALRRIANGANEALPTAPAMPTF